MKYLNCLLLLALVSCSSGKVRDLGIEPYRTSGVEQYFLSDLPQWANGSLSGQCFRKHNVQFFDFPKLQKAFNLTYPEFLEFQAQYNKRLENYFRTVTVKFVKPMEEAAFFSNTLENVRGGVRSFKVPAEAKKVDIIWLDRYIAQDKIDEIHEMQKSGRFDERLPVIFSACLSQEDLNQWLVEYSMDNYSFYGITAEWLAPFGSDLSPKAAPQIEIQKLFGKDVKIEFIRPKESLLPPEVVL